MLIAFHRCEFTPQPFSPASYPLAALLRIRHRNLSLTSSLALPAASGRNPAQASWSLAKIWSSN
jgi:hypothetical protein